jgi:carboxymethylenebutenolidase
MCDERTEAENEAYLARQRLSRREAGMGAGATLAAMLTGCGASPAPAQAPDSAAAAAPPPAAEPAAAAQPPAPEPTAPLETSSKMVEIDTPDGSAEAFFVTPPEGQHPGILMWPDVAGLRDAYKTMATRLASEGYAVLAVNQYYRSTKLPVLNTFAEWRTEAGKAKIGPMREAITPEGVTRDATTFAAWLDRQQEVTKSKNLGTAGYCMGGPFAFRTAAAIRERVGVIASFHGGGLVADEPTSPHKLFSEMKAAALICIAQNDDERDLEAKAVLKNAAEKAQIHAEIEVYPAQHGWCTIDSPVYDEEQAERAWARMLATFQRYL